MKEKIAELTNACIDNDHTFLVDVEIKGNPNNQKVQVFIDADEAVDIDECSKISRKLSAGLEENDWIQGRYTIEVSSPGVSRPLKYARQYPKHIGRELEIVLKEKGKVTGELLEALEEQIIISVSSKKGSEDLEINFSEIISARVLVRF